MVVIESTERSDGQAFKKFSNGDMVVAIRTEQVAYRYCVSCGTIFNTCMDQRYGERNMIEVFAKEPVNGDRVVITYLTAGYRLPVPMIDGGVYSVSDEVADAFVGASMFGWAAPVANPAHEWVKSLDL